MRSACVLVLALASCAEPSAAQASGMSEFSWTPSERLDVGAARARSAPPPGFVDVAEAVPGAVVDARYAGPENFTGAPLPGYVPDTLWMHRDAAEALARVQATVAEQDLRLRVYDAYRPARASEAMVDWARDNGRTNLLRDGYIARKSNHARGNTVDLTLERSDGTPLDMGTQWDAFSPSSHYAAAKGEPKRNRAMLRRAMMRAGFVPYAREWWHFSLPRELPGLDVPYGPG